jgi:2-oxoglutarate ferredoxin oxidoreductase subunit alpha
MQECRDQLSAKGVKTDYMRIRAVPFTDEVLEFVKKHDRIYVIDQNRDSQMHGLLQWHLKDGQYTDKLISVRHYDGTPVDARSLSDQILQLEKAYL